jgi:hypothetical protein
MNWDKHKVIDYIREHGSIKINNTMSYFEQSELRGILFELLKEEKLEVKKNWKYGNFTWYLKPDPLKLLRKQKMQKIYGKN